MIRSRFQRSITDGATRAAHRIQALKKVNAMERSSRIKKIESIDRSRHAFRMR